ncbi:hypothetical protein BFAG_00284 [Bacteroides fragilis 3_1_12]|uniref:Uncharacterized protein n=1 Tax=Bacteroides fragilis 3_1_12 TaxID=457424 RepID=A0ABN0BF88_BACFG|nr:hypothetical protein BFAG_00284 [Bacteroides fragilis 3_1_12]
MSGLFYVPIYDIQNCNFLIYNHSGDNRFYISSAQVRLETYTKHQILNLN